MKKSEITGSENKRIIALGREDVLSLKRELDETIQSLNRRERKV